LNESDTPSDLDRFFQDQPVARQLFDGLLSMGREIGAVEMKITRSQIAFLRAKPFAWAWRPGQYLAGHKTAPLVLSLVFPYQDPSPRWKQIVEPARGRFMHHLELFSLDDLDDEVRHWLQCAWDQATGEPAL